tara:strand:+ start:782 stop:979 length:198 start_codon:yes stop_codon:yes gene_type:complete
MIKVAFADKEGFLIYILKYIGFGIIKEAHAYGTCITIILRLWKAEVAFSVGKRNADPRLEAFGEA